MVDGREILRLAHPYATRVRSETDWFVIPFLDDSQAGDFYEESDPATAARFGRNVNIPERFDLPRAGLRLRTVRGAALLDYVRSAYAGVLESDRRTLGGQNVVATTLFQMNNHLELINNFMERGQESQNLNLYSLSAMQMELVDDRDDTNIAVLVNHGVVRIKSLTLGT